MAKLHEPSPGDVIIATGLGLLGGALAGAFAIRKVSGTSTPYDVPLALAVLKLPLGLSRQSPGYCCSVAGSCRAFLNWIPSGRFLAYALLFGYAQQLGTQFIDKRAETILQSIPAKDENE